MDYSDDSSIEMRDKQVRLLRQAISPILNEKASKEDIQKLSLRLYKELDTLGNRIDKKVEATKAKDVDMNPIADLLGAVMKLASREIKNQVKVELPEIAGLTKQVEAAIDYMKKNSDVQAELIKDFTTPKKTPKDEPAEMRVANFDDFKMPDVHVTSGARFPFLPSNGQTNVALQLINANGVDSMPVVLQGGTTTISGSINRSWVLASGTDSVTVNGFVTTSGSISGVVKTIPQGITTISGSVSGDIRTYPQGYTLISGAVARSWVLQSGIDQLNIGNFPTIQTIQGFVTTSGTIGGVVQTVPQGVTTISGTVSGIMQTIPQGITTISGTVGGDVRAVIQGQVTTSGVRDYPDAFDNNELRAVASGVAIQGQNSQLSGRSGVIVQALAGNQGIIKVGNSTRQKFELQAGQATGISIANLQQLYLLADFINDGICWIGS